VRGRLEFKLLKLLKPFKPVKPFFKQFEKTLKKGQKRLKTENVGQAPKNYPIFEVSKEKNAPPTFLQTQRPFFLEKHFGKNERQTLNYEYEEFKVSEKTGK